MQLTPRYGAQPVITLDGPPAAIAGPLIRQRRRLATALASFTDEQWSHPSRCAGWSNRDVIVHLDSTNTFWSMSIAAGVHGEPTRFLATFDPVASQAQLVAGSGDVSTGEVPPRFGASTAAPVGLCSALAHPGRPAAVTDRPVERLARGVSRTSLATTGGQGTRRPASAGAGHPASLLRRGDQATSPATPPRPQHPPSLPPPRPAPLAHGARACGQILPAALATVAEPPGHARLAAYPRAARLRRLD